MAKKKVSGVKILNFAQLCAKVVPAFITKPQSTTVAELKDGDKNELTYVHTKTGALKFSDMAGDTHTVSVTPKSSGYLGTLSAAINQNTDTVNWTFKLSDGAIDHLAVGQTLTQVYTLKLKDYAGNTTTTTVTVKIVGTNDAPFITSKTQGGCIVEVADCQPGENATTHQATGTITFKDVDKIDTHSASVKPLGGNYLGTLELGSVNQSSDSVGWTFKVDDALLDSLGPKDILVQKYEVTIDDGHGGKATTVVTITIKGADDKVHIFDLTPAAQGGDASVDEDDLVPGGSDTTKESTTATGNFKISAPDGVKDLTVDGHFVIQNGTFASTQFTTLLGNTITFISYDASTGTITYSYTLNGAETHGATGEDTLFEKLAVLLTDKDGSSANASLDVKIVDDVPAIRAKGYAPCLEVDETHLFTPDTEDFSGAFSSTYGADGAGSIVYALGVNAGATGLVDSVTLETVVLSVNGSGEVEGRTANSDELVFKLSVNSSGQVTLTQSRAVIHSDPNSDNDAKGLNAASLITLKATVTDGDGDKADATIDIGGKIKFYDAAPSITAGGQAPLLTVDETHLNTSASGNFSSVFSHDYGSDGAGSVAYALGVKAGESGLIDTESHQNVILSLNGGVIEGRTETSNLLVFSVSVDSNGNVTLTLSRAVEHSDPSNHNESAGLSAADLVTLTATITDKDGDTDSATLNIGDKLSFLDDGLSAKDDTDSVTLAASVVLNFDDVLNASNGQPLASGEETPIYTYGGFTWVQTGVYFPNYFDHDATPGPDLGYVATSGTSLAFFGEATGREVEGYPEPGGSPIRISDGVFSFLGASFVSAVSGPLTITARGFVNGVAQGLVDFTFDVNFGTPVFIDFSGIAGFSNIDEIRFDSANYFGFDDFTYRAGTEAATGNVISGTDGILGSDSNSTDGQGDDLGADGFGSIAWDNANVAGDSVQGTYGTLTVDANGNYSYVVDQTNAVIRGLKPSETKTETFTYTIKDGDGDSDTATLTITIRGSDDGVHISGLTPAVMGGDVTVDEDDLANGSDTTKESTTGTGSFFISAPDGVQTLSIDGHVVILNGALVASPSFSTSVLGNTLTVTSYDASTGEVTYTYTLTGSGLHAAANDENALFENLSVTLTDTDGDTATSTLAARIIDDVPDVGIAPSPSEVNEGSAINGTWSLTPGADGVSSVQISFDGNVLWLPLNQNAPVVFVTSTGTLSVSSDFTWSFAANQVSADTPLGFTIRATDADGDTDVASHDFTVKNVNQPMIISGTIAGVVEEEHLPTGIDDEAAAAPDNDLDVSPNFGVTTNAVSGNFAAGLSITGVDGTLSFGLANVDAATKVQTTGGADVTSDGKQVYYALDGGKLIGYTNGDGGNGAYGSGDTKIFEIAINSPSSGDYTFTLLKPIDHPINNPASEESLTLDLTGRVTATDDGGPASDIGVSFPISITVIDDVPVAKNDAASVVEGEGKDLNCVFVLDFSGSIDNTELDQMLDAVEAAAQQLFSGTSGDVAIRLVPFASTSTDYGPFTTFAALKAQLDAVNPNAGGSRPFSSSTDFTDAIERVMDIYTPVSGASNQVFFLSDGNPNQQTGTNGNSLDDATHNDWLAFVNGAIPINVTTIGIGDGIDNARLQDVDLDGTGSPITVSNFDDLVATLLTVVQGGDVSGNVLLGNDNVVGGGDDDLYGADGPGRISSIVINGVTYSFNGTNTITPSVGSIISGTQLSNIADGQGGKLTFNFATGAWSYTAPSSVGADLTRSFSYTIVDNDGDASQASLSVTVVNRNDAPVNTLPAAITINEDAAATKLTGLSFADPDIGSSLLTVTFSVPSGALSATSGGDVTVSGTSNALTLTGTLSAINSFVSGSGVFYTPAPDANGTVQITVTSSDGGATGVGGVKTDTDTIAINITGVNDAPVATVPASAYSATEQISLNLHGTGLSVFDVDAGNNSISVQLSVASGTLTATAGNSGANVSGSGTQTLTITGSQTQINNLLGGIDTGPGAAGTITYLHSSDTPPPSTTLTLLVNDTGDTGSGGAKTDSKSVTINITPVDDAPTIDVNGSASYTVGNAGVVLDSSITITDVDSATMSGATVRISNNFAAGDVLSFTNQLGITGAYNAATGILTLTGTASRANYETALESITFSSSAADSATRTVSFTVTDGTTNSASDTATVSVSVPTFNPIIVAPSTLQFLSESDSDPLTPINRISFQDLDSLGTVRVTLTMDDSEDSLIASSGGGVTVGNSGNSSITLDGTIAAINAFLFSGAVQWNSENDFNSSDLTGQLTITIDDNGTTAGGNTAMATVNISEFTPDGSAPINNDFSSINIDGSGGSFTLAGANNSSDTLTTSWRHQPLDTTAIYSGGNGAGTDTINLVFTPDQIEQILSGTSTQNALRAFLASPTVGLDLNGTSWNAQVTGFEAAHVALTTGYGRGTFSLDTILMPTPAAQTTPTGNDDLIIGTAGSDTSLGGASGSNGDDVIVGLAGNDTLRGGSGNDLLLGGAGDDTLIGGIGNDVLSGSIGADRFVFAETGSGNVDRVLDYSYAENDRVVLSDLLDANFTSGSNISQFVTLVQSGNDITVRVDTDGPGGGSGFVDVAVLLSVGTANNDPVRVFFEGQDWVLTV